jgi:transcriptional regulator with XRE-family HTH domain
MERLRELREILGLSQYQMSSLTGIERSRISAIECSHVALTSEEISKVKRAVLLALERRTGQFRQVLAKLEASAEEVSV